MNPLFDPAELKREAEVVIEESNRKLDNPPAVSMERMFATAFTQHRMKRWRIGSNEVLRSIRRPNLLAFFEGLYRPENIIVAITGDVTPEEARRAALETFGTIPRGEVKKARGPKEPPQTAFRYGRSTADITQSYSVFGWHTPGVGHPDEIPLELLAMILGTGRSSRLFTGAVGPDAASTIEAGYQTFDDIGILTVQASFAEKNRATVDRRTLQEVERIKAHGPTSYELARAKNLVESEIAFGVEDALGQARTLSQYEARHGYKALGTQLRERRAVTAERVRDVARRYLSNENLTLYHYAPPDAKAMTPEEALASVIEATKSAPAAIEDARIPAATERVRAAGSDPSVRETTLSNGATLVVMERTGAPLVTVGVYFEGGRIDETSRNAGITNLMVHTTRRGTTSRSAEAIDREVEFLGSAIGFDVAEDYVGFTLDILSPNFTSGLALLADIVLNPTFPEQGVTEERFLQTSEIERSLDSSQERPLQLLAQALYVGHPYGLPANGYVPSIAALDGEALRRWWREHVVSDAAVILVVGDVATEDAKRSVEAAFAELPKSRGPRAPVPPFAPPTARTEAGEYRARKQSAIAVAFPTVPRTHEDWPALRLLQNVTSGGAGTLFIELRGRRSLAYTVYARDASAARSGAFLAYLACEAAKETEAREALMREIRRLPTDAFGENELATAKASFAGGTRIRLQQNGARVTDLARNRFYGLPLDFTWKLLDRTQTITLPQIRAVAGKYLVHDRFVEAILHGKS